MASCKLKTTKAGKRFYEISVSRGYGVSPFTERWYVPDGWSEKSIQRELNKVASDFERRCHAGEVLTRVQRKERQEQEAAEAAKLKTLRQYVDGVFMPLKETTLSENTRSSYRMFFDKHIFPAFGRRPSDGDHAGHDYEGAGGLSKGGLRSRDGCKIIQLMQRRF